MMTTAADLLAKVPVFQDEMQDAVGGLADGGDPADSLSGAAWLGLFHDFERLSKGMPERPESAGDDLSEPGFILFEDTAGGTRRKPVADWIAYMALRLYHVARNEEMRASSAASAAEPVQDADALHDRLRRDLRIDALHDLAFRSREVFEASREYGVGDRWRNGAEDAASHIPVAMGERFDAAHAAWLVAVEADCEPSERYQAAIKEAQDRGGPTVEEYEAAWKLDGVKHAHDAEAEAFATVAELSVDILRRPARSVADLAVQARAVIPQVWAMGTYEADAALAPDEDIDKEAVRLLVESCCAAAGVDWRGQPGAAAVASTPSPALDTERHESAFHAASTELRLATRDHERLVNPSDDVWVEQNGGDTSAEAMAPAVAARDAAAARKYQAWRDLFKIRPRTWHQMWLSDPARHIVPFQNAARELGLSPTTLRRMCRENVGPTLLQISERRLGIWRGDLDAWVESRKVCSPQIQG